MNPRTHLVAQLRALIETVRTADLEEAASAGVDLGEIASQLQTLASQLLPHTVDAEPTQVGLRREIGRMNFDRARHITDGGILDIFPYSPIIGELNPVAPPLSFWRDGSTVRGSGRIPTSLNGPPASVHGGLVAAILDELLGMAAVVAGVGGFTGTLTVRYLRPTPIATDLDLRAQVESVDGRKVMVTGQIASEGQVCATAEATFIRPNFATQPDPI